MMENLRKQSQDTNWYEKFDLFVILFLFDCHFLVNLPSLWESLWLSMCVSRKYPYPHHGGNFI